MLKIIQHRRIYLTIALIVTITIIGLWLVWGLRLGIDFTGGTLMEAQFQKDRPTNQMVREAVTDLNLGSIDIQTLGAQGLIFRFKEIDEVKHQELLNRLEEKFGSGQSLKIANSDVQIVGQEAGGVNVGGIQAQVVTEKQVIENRFESIGSVIGQELKNKSVYALILAAVLINLYIAWAFRRVSKPVSSWKYGLAAIIALIHDILILVGAFVVLGHYLNYEINTSFVAALLTVFGYSINDTIVVFDRIRENLPRSSENFENTVNNSINQTMGRSINTTLTTLLALLAVYFLGGATIKTFALALMIGIGTGAYSSIFIASPLLVAWHKFSLNRSRRK